jgi:hypothetical protein
MNEDMDGGQTIHLISIHDGWMDGNMDGLYRSTITLVPLPF